MAACICGKCTEHAGAPLLHLQRWMERTETIERGSLSRATEEILTTEAIEEVIRHPGGTP